MGWKSSAGKIMAGVLIGVVLNTTYTYNNAMKYLIKTNSEWYNKGSQSVNPVLPIYADTKFDKENKQHDIIEESLSFSKFVGNVWKALKKRL